MDMLNLMPKERPKLRPCCKNKKPWLEGTLDTVYKGDFVGKEVPVERATRKYDGYNIFGNKFDGTTTMGQDFKPYEAKREAPIKPTNTDLGIHGPFQGASTYDQDFGPKEVSYVRVKPQHHFQPNSAPLESVTTHRLAFQPKEVSQPARAVTHGTSIPTSAGPFDGRSLYKDTFQKQPYAKRSPAIPMHSSDVIPSGRFDDGTMYKTTFTPKEVCRPELARPQDARPSSRQGWYGGAPSTEYRGQFPGKEVPKPETIQKVQSAGILPKGAFDGTTINKSDFKPYSVPGGTQIIRPSPAFERENLPFNGESTYKSNFIPMDVPYQRSKPQQAYQPNNAVFDGTTTHRAAYIPMEVAPVRRVEARRNNIGNSQEPFEGSSTYKNDFTKMPGGRQRMAVPKETKYDNGPFDGTTTYRLDFHEKEIPAPFVRKRDDDCESCFDGVPGVTCRELADKMMGQ